MLNNRPKQGVVVVDWRAALRGKRHIRRTYVFDWPPQPTPPPPPPPDAAGADADADADAPAVHARGGFDAADARTDVRTVVVDAPADDARAAGAPPRGGERSLRAAATVAATPIPRHRHTFFIRELRVIDGALGCAVWDGGLLLARYLHDCGRPPLAGAAVLEVGAGCGLVGLVAARSAASVTRTDYVPAVVANLAHNVRLNDVASLEKAEAEAVEDDEGGERGRLCYCGGKCLFYCS
ncbi:hypothetical protein I4F81_006012 [Pyropia yezoensis]|uniref:Uncharacterized protein n=1 Tax=Pyropia yezoensis TaxID=2788 RepID=A0ACC3C0Y5_PYRYE|nr:hypothetical protein I4F81_006012 [Neopyropia yezoensis]